MVDRRETDPLDADEVAQLREEVRELTARIRQLEHVIDRFQEPFRHIGNVARGYYRLIDLYARFGSVAPDVLVPAMKDPIASAILNVLFERDGQNISQITAAVRDRRGTASRRIVRERLKQLVAAGHVEPRREKRAVRYYVSEPLLKKWSEVLGFPIPTDHTYED